MAHRINVKVKFEFKHESLAKILPMGFELTLEPSYKNDKFEGYTFVGTDGNTYNDSEIYRFVGNKPLSELFEKI